MRLTPAARASSLSSDLTSWAAACRATSEEEQAVSMHWEGPCRSKTYDSLRVWVGVDEQLGRLGCRWELRGNTCINSHAGFKITMLPSGCDTAGSPARKVEGQCLSGSEIQVIHGPYTHGNGGAGQESAAG